MVFGKTGIRWLTALTLAIVSGACNGDMAHDAGTSRDVHTTPDGSDAYTAPDTMIADGHNGGEDVVSMIDGSTGHPSPGATCDDSIALVAGTARIGDSTPSAGIGSTACRPSTAPQRFYSFDIPVASRAIIRVTPTGAWRATVRVYQHCDLTMCITDGESDVLGAPVELVVDNTTDVVLHKTITVSGADVNLSGFYDILATLEALPSGDAGPDASTPDDAGPSTDASTTDDASTGIDSGAGTDGSGADSGTGADAGSDTSTETDSGTAGACSLATERALTLPNDAFDGILDGVDRIASSRCGSANGGEDIFPLHVASRIGVTFVSTNRNTILSLRRTCDDATSETSCYDNSLDFNGSGAVSVFHQVLEPGDYYFILNSHSSTAAPYHLTVSTFVPGPESSCDTAPSLVTASARGNTSSGGTASVSCGASNPQVFYSLPLPAHTRAIVQLSQGENLVPPGMQVLSSCDALACSGYAAVPGGDSGVTSMFVDNPGDTARTFVISVGTTRAIGADYSIGASLSSLAPYAANATCSGATVLGPTTTISGEDLARSGTQVQCSVARYPGANLFYRASIPAGQILSFAAAPSSFVSDPVIRTLSACGADTCGVVMSSDAEEMLHVANTGSTTQDLIIAVGGARAFASQPVDVRAAIRTPATNAACHAAQMVTPGATLTGLDLGTGWSTDRDQTVETNLQALYYSVDLANDATITVTASPTGSTTPRLALLADCSTVRSAAQFGTTDAAGVSQLTYTNHTGATQRLLVVAYANAGFVHGTFDLSF